MGGRTSQPLPLPPSPPNDGDQQEGGGSSGGDEGGFFTLSESLQEQMALQFQNEQVIKMFGRQMEKIGERKANAYKDAMDQRVQLQHKMEAFRKSNETRQGQLNATIEGYEDKFTDVSNIVEYDISRLEKKYSLTNIESSSSEGERIPCFSEQTNIVTCLRNDKFKKDPFLCDAFIRALDSCTQKTITKS